MNFLLNKWVDADFGGKVGLVALALFLALVILGVALVPAIRLVVGAVLGACILVVFCILAVHGLFTLLE
jgi:hypothetical protein